MFLAGFPKCSKFSALKKNNHIGISSFQYKKIQVNRFCTIKKQLVTFRVPDKKRLKFRVDILVCVHSLNIPQAATNRGMGCFVPAQKKLRYHFPKTMEPNAQILALFFAFEKKSRGKKSMMYVFFFHVVLLQKFSANQNKHCCFFLGPAIPNSIEEIHATATHLWRFACLFVIFHVCYKNIL